jgi:hypothetical protein
LVIAAVPGALGTRSATHNVLLLNRAGASNPEILSLNGSEDVAGSPVASDGTAANRKHRTRKHDRYRRGHK